MTDTGRIVAGRYRLESLLGQGAMGKVYEAVHLVTNRRVALKVVPIESHRESDRISRLIREARAPNEVRHPNIVDVSDAGRDDDGSFFIVMELLEGVTVEDALRMHGRITGVRLAQIFDPLLSALDALHKHGLIHRDLKPANIFLAGDPAAPLVKILDFGLAKALFDDVATASGVMMGTPAYMSPEQILSTKDASRASDLWSVGVILFECLAGRRPFAGNVPSILHEVASDRSSPPVREAEPSISIDLAAVIDRLLEKNPERRPRSAAELRSELLPLLRTGVPNAGAAVGGPDVLALRGPGVAVDDAAETVRRGSPEPRYALPPAMAPTVRIPGAPPRADAHDPTEFARPSPASPVYHPNAAPVPGAGAADPAAPRTAPSKRGWTAPRIAVLTFVAVGGLSLAAKVIAPLLESDVRTTPVPTAPPSTTPPHAPNAPAVVPASAAARCFGRSGDHFHFRPNETFDRDGPNLPPGTDFEILSVGTIRRAQTQIYRIRLTVTGEEGYAFIPAYWFLPSCPPSMPRFGPTVAP